MKGKNFQVSVSKVIFGLDKGEVGSEKIMLNDFSAIVSF